MQVFHEKSKGLYLCLRDHYLSVDKVGFEDMSWQHEHCNTLLLKKVDMDIFSQIFFVIVEVHVTKLRFIPWFGVFCNKISMGAT